MSAGAGGPLLTHPLSPGPGWAGGENNAVRVSWDELDREQPTPAARS